MVLGTCLRYACYNYAYRYLSKLFFGQRIEIFVGSSVLALESKCRLARSTIVDRAGRERGGGRGEREREESY